MDPSVGTILRKKREEKKITLDQVFEDTRIRLTYLQAIENDQLEQIPSRAQAHGFIRLYANYLDLDPYPLLEMLTPAPIAEPQPVTPVQSGKPESTPAQIEENIKKVVTSFIQEGKTTLNEKGKKGLQQVQSTFDEIVEKIPYKIVKKGQPVEPPKPVEEIAAPVKPAGSNKSYRVMCKAIGANLREKRESLGLSLSDVERQTRIREVYLFALEEGNLDDLPSTVQGRGMLSNYAGFMGLDSEAFLSKFAEALQQKRVETLPEEEVGIPLPTAQVKEQPITGLKRLISPDLIFTGSLFLVFFVFIIWGSVQLVSINSSNSKETVVPISDILLASGTPNTSALVTVEGATAEATEVVDTSFNTTDNLQQTLSATQTGAIQLVIVAHHRAFMKITVDGKEQFNGRVVPGTIYSYTGDTAIVMLTGDGSALEVYYNQNDLGIIGNTGQVVNYQFTAKGSTDLGALNTATPVPTSAPTLTPVPTNTPTATPTSTPEFSPTPTGAK